MACVPPGYRHGAANDEQSPIQARPGYPWRRPIIFRKTSPRKLGFDTGMVKIPSGIYAAPGYAQRSAVFFRVARITETGFEGSRMLDRHLTNRRVEEIALRDRLADRANCDRPQTPRRAASRDHTSSGSTRRTSTQRVDFGVWSGWWDLNPRRWPPKDQSLPLSYTPTNDPRYNVFRCALTVSSG
jgi:hypothetical protein